MVAAIAPNASRCRSVWIDLSVSCGLVLCFMAAAHVKGWYPNSLSWLKHDYRSHIGAEYDCIARAIRAGRGFSDPFHEETGPTAWMPPVLPYLMAGVYWLSGDRPNVVMISMVVLQGIATWSACFLVLREARLLSRYLAGLLITSLLFTANFFQLFQQTHDTGLLLLVISLLWFGLTRWPDVTNSWLATAWGAWGGFVTLCSPIVGAAWLVFSLTTKNQWRKLPACGPKSSTWKLPPWLLAILLWGIVISPWTIRNRVQLGKWLPIKSNGMYEVWQSQCLDADGVLDTVSSSGHPWSSAGALRMRYSQIGEIAFVAEKARLAKASIFTNPLGFAERVANRSIAALVIYTPFQSIEAYRGYGWPLFFARVVHPLTFIAITCLALFSKVPIHDRIWKTVLLFALLLGPYVLISYYDRYAAILVGLKSLIVLYSWDAISGFVAAIPPHLKLPKSESKKLPEQL